MRVISPSTMNVFSDNGLRLLQMISVILAQLGLLFIRCCSVPLSLKSSQFAHHILGKFQYWSTEVTEGSLVLC